MGLKEARAKRDEARKQLAAGIDPSAARKAAKAADDGSFEAVAREWYAKHAPRWAPGHADNTIRRLERDVFPWLGDPARGQDHRARAAGVPSPYRGARRIETAHRVLQDCGKIFRYAIATGRAERDPATDLRGALPPATKTHHAAITDPKAVGALLRAIDGYRGDLPTRCALRTGAPHVRSARRAARGGVDRVRP